MSLVARVVTLGAVVVGSLALGLASNAGAGMLVCSGGPGNTPDGFIKEPDGTKIGKGIFELTVSEGTTETEVPITYRLKWKNLKASEKPITIRLLDEGIIEDAIGFALFVNGAEVTASDLLEGVASLVRPGRKAVLRIDLVEMQDASQNLVDLPFRGFYSNKMPPKCDDLAVILNAPPPD